MFCQKCGKQNRDDATRCDGCGEPLVPVQQPAGQNDVRPQQKKKHGCLTAFLIALGIFVALGVLISIIASLAGNDGQTNGATSAPDSVQAQTVTPEAGKIGDYNVTIKDSKVVQNGDENILIVTYTFTNNSKESESFLYAISDKLFQNGVELGDVYTSWGIEDEYDFEAKSR